MSIHEDILAAVELYVSESEKFEVKGVAASASRARGALGNLGKLTKARRAEIQQTKNDRAAAKK